MSRDSSELGGFGPRDGGELGSLAQAARRKNIKSARTTLIVVGVLTVLGQTAMYFIEQGQIDQMLRQEFRDAGNVNPTPAEMAEAKAVVNRVVVVAYAGVMLIGVAFVVMGAFVERAPVPITAAALVLFIGLHAAFAVIDPTNLARGWILKVIFLVALVKALQSALAAAREERAAARPAGPFA